MCLLFSVSRTPVDSSGEDDLVPKESTYHKKLKVELIQLRTQDYLQVTCAFSPTPVARAHTSLLLCYLLLFTHFVQTSGSSP